jgi:hypothetical protein
MPMHVTEPTTGHGTLDQFLLKFDTALIADLDRTNCRRHYSTSNL